MSDGLLPPAYVLLAAAVLVGLTRGHVRSLVIFGAPVLTLWAIWQVPDGVAVTANFLGYAIEPVEGSPVRRLFATIFAIMAFTGGLFAFRHAKWYELAAPSAYAAGAVGVCFAGDLITLLGEEAGDGFDGTMDHLGPIGASGMRITGSLLGSQIPGEVMYDDPTLQPFVMTRGYLLLLTLTDLMLLWYIA